MASDEATREVAAVDLGSNSFHMMVARVEGAGITVLDRLREAVRLGAGLDENKRLTAEAQQRALDCLARFGQRLKLIPPDRVRVVGTSTLRRMKNRADFLAAAEAALGHSIEVISGREEGRLVYAGVTHGMGPENPRRLVVDIGGGSTELVIGDGLRPKLLESAAMGCVEFTRRYFEDGEITRKRFNKARVAARVELEFLERRYRKAGWDVALGSSGTIRGVWRVMRAKDWIGEEITAEALEKAADLLVDTGQISKIDYTDLREDRRPVFAGGLAVLAGVFDALRLKSMHTSESALREGIVFDLLGRLGDHDVRDEAVASLARRYGVDKAHAAAVEKTALKFLDPVTAGWKLERKAARAFLSWSARLHEIGLVIAHAGYHKHGEYILRNCDLQGFSQPDQEWLAALVRLHRGKFAAVAQQVPRDRRGAVTRLAVVLRLAVLLHRARPRSLRLTLELKVRDDGLEIEFPKKWLDRHPLTAADLEREVDYLKAADFRLRYQ